MSKDRYPIADPGADRRFACRARIGAGFSSVLLLSSVIASQRVLSSARQTARTDFRVGFRVSGSERNHRRERGQNSGDHAEALPLAVGERNLCVNHCQTPWPTTSGCGRDRRCIVVGYRKRRATRGGVPAGSPVRREPAQTRGRPPVLQGVGVEPRHASIRAA